MGRFPGFILIQTYLDAIKLSGLAKIVDRPVILSLSEDGDPINHPLTLRFRRAWKLRVT
jgi:hypothetical protein